MDSREFEEIYLQLNTLSDVKKIAKKRRLPQDMLTVLFSQKIVRETTKRHHIIKKKAHQLLSEWRKGKTLLMLSKKMNYAPGMTTSIILQEMGYTRKKVRDILKNPSDAEDYRISSELEEVLENELVYSPQGAQEQTLRGKMVEERVGKWLDGRGVAYITEDEAKKLKHPKTPDFLLKKNIRIDGVKVHWVECKASFGDKTEFRRDHRKQLKHYLELFGPGAVVYWYGFVDDVGFDGILLKNRKTLYM